MNVGVIGSGSIGPDLAYGFVSALAGGGNNKVLLHDIRKDALDAGVARIQGYVRKGLSRGRLSPRVADSIGKALVPTLDLNDLAACDYVLEAATEHLATKRVILGQVEAVVRRGLPDRVRDIRYSKGTDRGGSPASESLLRQPPVLSRLARPAHRGRAVGRRPARPTDARSADLARQGARGHRRRPLLRGRRHLLQLHQRGGTDCRRRHRDAGPGRSHRQRPRGRRRPLQRHGPDSRQHVDRSLPGADEGRPDRQRVVRRTSHPLSPGRRALDRSDPPCRRELLSGPRLAGDGPDPGRAAGADLLRRGPEDLRPVGSELADAKCPRFQRRAARPRREGRRRPRAQSLQGIRVRPIPGSRSRRALPRSGSARFIATSRCMPRAPSPSSRFGAPRSRTRSRLARCRRFALPLSPPTAIRRCKGWS